MRTCRRVLGLSSCLLLVSAACGGNDGEGNTSFVTSATVTETATASGETGDDTASETGSASNDGSTSGDGDGDAGDGDGSTGDGDGSTGDGDGSTGDGDGSTGDGDGSTGDGDGSTGDGDGSTGDGDGDGSTGDGDGDGSTGDGDGDGESCWECAENTDLIYVLSDDAELWSFDPATNMFALVAALPCPGGLFNGTFSMSVSRAGIAWVMYQDGQMYQVDVNAPGTCMNSGWVSNSGFNLFGMGFVSNSLADPCEKLYAHSWSGLGGFSEGLNSGQLGAIEPSDLSVAILGGINYDGGELTGTGDGRLFAFAGATPAKLVEYDKTNANEIATTLLVGLDLTNAFAFAHYDGDFFFFTEEGLGATSKVTYYDPDVPGVFSQVASAPIRIVGAGVSTCAPVPE